RRPLLRAERLPDRDAARARAGADRRDLAQELLRAAHAADLPAVLPAARRAGGDRRRAAAVDDARRLLPRAAVVPDLPDRLGRADDDRLDHLVARGGGAVLSAVAADRALPAAPRAEGPAAPDRREPAGELPARRRRPARDARL